MKIQIALREKEFAMQAYFDEQLHFREHMKNACTTGQEKR